MVKVLCHLELVKAAHAALQWPQAEGRCSQLKATPHRHEDAGFFKTELSRNQATSLSLSLPHPSLSPSLSDTHWAFANTFFISLYTPPTFLWLNLLAHPTPALQRGEI